LHVLEAGAVDAARIAGVAVVDLVVGLVAGDADLVGVDDDDEVAGVDVRRVDGLVLAAQAEGDFTGHPSEDLVGRVNHKPLMRHLGRLGAEGFHGEYRVGSTARPAVGATFWMGGLLGGPLRGREAIMATQRVSLGLRKGKAEDSSKLFPITEG